MNERRTLDRHQQRILNSPQQAEYYLNIAEIYQKQNKFEAALRAYEKALEVSANSAEISRKVAEFYQFLGKRSLQQQKWHEAIAYFANAFYLNPALESPDFYFNLGNLLVDLKQTETAITCYQKALKSNPNSAETYLNLGIVYRQIGRDREAELNYRQAIAIAPRLSQAYFSLGNLLRDRQQREAAIACYLETLQIDPDFEAAYLNLSYVYKDLGKLGESFDFALHLLPENILEPKLDPDRPLSVIPDRANPGDRPQFPCQMVHPAGVIKFKKPRNGDRQSHPYFKWKEYLYSASFIAQFDRAIVWGSKHLSAILTRDRTLVLPLSQGSSELIALSEKLPEPVELNGTIAFLSVRGGQTYFHWMSDLLGRFELLRAAGIDWQSIDRFIVNSTHLPYQQESLSLLGIDSDRLVESRLYPHVQTERSIVPSLPGDPGLMTPRTCEFLRELFLRHARVSGTVKNIGDRLYISREQASYRRVVNEGETIAYLSQFGFVKVSLESLSFREQVGLFSQARAIVAPHGAGLTNLVFCEPETRVIEIFSPQAISINYWAIANLRHLQYYYLIGKDLSEFYRDRPQQRRRYPHPLYEDICVDLEALREAIERADWV
ncbi:tetratricopeptide repeat protein [Oxynema aestuarii]|uniref:DUF563 domain-containing protein n=1 Tax=Oxynema aestuarii AP17 TaxID=2064643 RepID=A0A6H1TYU4_9CYAN|nr:tetratricopeptide repeat protein [Oxynema aestuarii]QIZ71772.1 DUF563 domain-containing protein [Oxynema aestuarii AP17]